MEELFLEYQKIIFVACNDKTKLIEGLKSMGIETIAYDYDPKFKSNPNYMVKDFIFDDIKFDAELVVHWNCEKTYPLGRIYKGDMLLIGDYDLHNGDCNPISSCEQLIEQNLITQVYESYKYGKHFIVHGNNLS